MPSLVATLLFCAILSSYALDYCPNCQSNGYTNCDCSWTNNRANCGGNGDGSCCWTCCCAPQTIQCTPSTCDCSWTNNRANCGANDGSLCWNCCCGTGAGTTPTPPTPPTPPSPPAPTVGSGTYCPSASDFIVAYDSGANNVQLLDQGWTITGGGAAATKASFNLVGGSVEYDIDFTNTGGYVNANIYTLSPVMSGTTPFSNAQYCDGQKYGSEWCTEVDWIESNGACGGGVALHTRPGTGSGVCNAWGCSATWSYGGQPSFHMKITYDADGKWTTVAGSHTFGPNSLNYPVQDSDWQQLKDHYTQRGAVIYSSQWTGWVPEISGGCPGGGNLATSRFTIRNLVITGSVVKGPTPRLC